MTDDKKKIRELEKKIAVMESEMHQMSEIKSDMNDLKTVVYDMKSTLDGLTGSKKAAVSILAGLATLATIVIAWINTK